MKNKSEITIKQTLSQNNKNLNCIEIVNDNNMDVDDDSKIIINTKKSVHFGKKKKLVNDEKIQSFSSPMLLTQEFDKNQPPNFV